MTIKKGTSTIATDSSSEWGNIDGTLSDQTDLKTALDAKAPTLNPEFTGIPTAPTAEEGTDTQQIATTAYVERALNNIDSLPDQTDQNGKCLMTDGMDAYWKSPAGLPLLSFIWSDHLLNDASFLRADTFSWQNGNFYKSVYEHLTNDISDATFYNYDLKIELNTTTNKYMLTIYPDSVITGPSGNTRTITGKPGVYGNSTHIGEEFYCFMSLGTGTEALQTCPVSQYFVQATAPTPTDSVAFWYDTTNNVIKTTFDTGAQWYGDFSYPLGKVINRGGDAGYNGPSDLIENYSGIQGLVSETIGSYTIRYYPATDGHKIIMPDQMDNAVNIYNETGVAWYYILDTTNTRFKLPRTKFGFTGYRDTVGKYVEPGLPNITGYAGWTTGSNGNDKTNYGAFTVSFGGSAKASQSSGSGNIGLNFDASLSNPIYGNSNTVQPPATQMYLYFYAGDTVRSETEIDVGEITEALNGKLDRDLSNASSEFNEIVSGLSMPNGDTIDLTFLASGVHYIAPANGYYNIGLSMGSGWANVNTSGGFLLPFKSGATYGSCIVPVKKGQEMWIDYSGVSKSTLLFVYAGD